MAATGYRCLHTPNTQQHSNVIYRKYENDVCVQNVLSTQHFKYLASTNHAFFPHTQPLAQRCCGVTVMFGVRRPSRAETIYEQTSKHKISWYFQPWKNSQAIMVINLGIFLCIFSRIFCVRFAALLHCVCVCSVRFDAAMFCHRTQRRKKIRFVCWNDVGWHQFTWCAWNHVILRVSPVHIPRIQIRKPMFRAYRAALGMCNDRRSQHIRRRSATTSWSNCWNQVEDK